LSFTAQGLCPLFREVAHRSPFLGPPFPPLAIHASVLGYFFADSHPRPFNRESPHCLDDHASLPPLSPRASTRYSIFSRSAGPRNLRSSTALLLLRWHLTYFCLISLLLDPLGSSFISKMRDSEQLFARFLCLLVKEPKPPLVRGAFFPPPLNPRRLFFPARPKFFL